MFYAKKDDLIKGEEISLRVNRCCPANVEKNWVSGYTFDILLSKNLKKVGQLSFRIETNEDINLYVGHIGYGIDEEFRGRNFAEKACLLGKNLLGKHLSSVIITCDPDNYASIKTIEKLGAELIETIAIPEEKQERLKSTQKNRYVWNI